MPSTGYYRACAPWENATVMSHLTSGGKRMKKRATRPARHAFLHALRTI